MYAVEYFISIQKSKAAQCGLIPNDYEAEKAVRRQSIKHAASVLKESKTIYMFVRTLIISAVTHWPLVPTPGDMN